MSLIDQEANTWTPKNLQNFTVGDRSATEVFTAEALQVQFTLLTFSYVVATQSLQVFKNGLLLAPKTEWVELTTTTFALTAQTSLNDIIIAVGYTGAAVVPAPVVDFPDNTIWYEFIATLGLTSHPGIAVGQVIIGNYFDGNYTTGSAVRTSYTGTIDVNKAGNVADDDGLYYDADGLQFDILDVLVPEHYGARRNGTIDDSAAINTCWAFASNEERPTELLAGTYKVNSTLYYTPVNSTLQSCHITGAGRGYDTTSIRQTLIDGSSIVAAPVLIGQVTRGTYLGKFHIKGANGTLFSRIPNVKDYTYINSDYVKAGVQDNQFAPQCGIAIDGGVGTEPATPWVGVTYRSLSGGSHGGVFEEISISQCVVGIGHQLDPNTAQGDRFVWRDCHFVDCKVPMAFGNTQSRVLTVTDCNFSRFRTAIDSVDYGAGSSNNPVVSGCQFGTGFEMVSGSVVVPMTWTGNRCEQVHRIGSYGIGSATDSTAVTFRGNDWNFLSNEQGLRCPIIFESPTAGVTFIGEKIKEGGVAADYKPFNFLAHATVFDTCFFKVFDTDKFAIEGAIDLGNPIEFKNCIVTDVNSRIELGPVGNRGIQNSTRIVGVAGGQGIRGGVKSEYVAQDFDRYLNIQTVSNYVFSDTELTFDCTDVTYLLVGDYLYFLMEKIARSATQYRVIALQVTAIAAPAVTCLLQFDRLYYDETDTPTALKLYRQQWAPGAPLTGDTDGSNVLLNVSPTTFLRVGDWIIGKDLALNSRVTIVNGGTVTLNKATLQVTSGIDLYWDMIKSIDMTSRYSPIEIMQKSQPTPNLSLGIDIYLTSSTTTITDFDNGSTGREITIIAEHAVKITDGTNIFLEDSLDFVMAVSDTLTIIQKADGKWYETGRSINSQTLLSVLADNATPPVLGGKSFITGGTTAITDFDDGVPGQEIVILSEHAITITDGTNIILNGSANFVMAASDSLTLIQKADNKWYETSRMVNL